MPFVRSRIALAAAGAILTSCSPSWPEDRFPEGLEVKRSLFAGGGRGFRETCEAIIVEITDRAASRILRVRSRKHGAEFDPPAGWTSTPIVIDEKQALFEGAFDGCERDGERPIGDLPGWLKRPGAFYKVINGGEGIAIIAPRAKLAGFYYFG